MQAWRFTKNILALIGVVSLLGMSIYLILAGKVKKDLDVSVVSKHPSPNGIVIAVLERGISTETNTFPIYYLTLQAQKGTDKLGNRWQVWHSQVHERPTIQWLDNFNLEISHKPYLVREYEPVLELNNDIYHVHLNIFEHSPNKSEEPINCPKGNLLAPFEP
ncbi:hypothetical protein [Sulfurimonas diazotrophicus]|uniref:DUF2271 domain-containing protein n=1 Tax=Sulfurimonas diazotrophicus TaxID=3131939 RepID=A0ABZ3HCD8_9BACT